MHIFLFHKISSIYTICITDQNKFYQGRTSNFCTSSIPELRTTTKNFGKLLTKFIFKELLIVGTNIKHHRKYLPQTVNMMSRKTK